jgi:hypothetical protein
MNKRALLLLNLVSATCLLMLISYSLLFGPIVFCAHSKSAHNEIQSVNSANELRELAVRLDQRAEYANKAAVTYTRINLSVLILLLGTVIANSKYLRIHS